MVAWRSGAHATTTRAGDATGCHVAAAVAPRALRLSCPEREARHVQQGTLRALFRLALCKRSQCIVSCEPPLDAAAAVREAHVMA